MKLTDATFDQNAAGAQGAQGAQSARTQIQDETRTIHNAQELSLLQTSPFTLFDKTWALVTAGTASDFNTMTVSWGSLGTLWSKPVVTVYVRPTRYTHTYLESSDMFTVTFFSDDYRSDLAVLGKMSGRDCDKIALTQLEPTYITRDDDSCMSAIGFKQAQLTLTCKKIYAEDFKLELIPTDAAQTYYPHLEEGDGPHTFYIGEVVGFITE